MNGILLIDKPQAWTSFDVVAKVRGILRRSGIAKPKVGHTGTLDPLATGLLVLVVGDYTKRAAEFSKLDKTYGAVMRLGETSSTGDQEGAKAKVSDMRPTRQATAAALRQFRGEINQIPPAYSAIKLAGQRAYKLARAGQPVTLEPRTVKIYRLDLISYDYPDVRFTATVSSGTYIRSLVEDMGSALGTGAYMSALRRTAVGSFSLDRALTTDLLTSELIQQNLLAIA